MYKLYELADIIKGQYRLISILGQGGTAITYEAEDIVDNSIVAIKVLSLHQLMDWKIIELFEREAEVLSSLNYSKIPQYIDYFYLDTEDNRTFFLVQELIPGKSLAALVEQGYYFQEDEVKNIAQQVLAILDYLHNLNPPVIHRDIKPHNIIRTDAGEIYLVDLGAVQDIYRNTLTYSGTFVGTIDYMPPEQMRGQATFASDFYSLGCTLLYLLTRRSPGELSLTRMKLNFRSALSISPQFADWLDILLEPDPDDRFQSTTEATKQLKSDRIFFKPQESKLVGSSIKITRTNNELIVKIPPQITYSQAFTCVLIVLPFMALLYSVLSFFLGFSRSLFFWVIAFLRYSPVYLSLLFLLIKTFSFRAKDLFSWVGYELKINRDSYGFQSSILGTKRRKNGKSIKLDKVNLYWDVNNAIKEKIVNGCVIRGKNCYYRFGRLLTRVEQEWLAKEMSDFIDYINS